MPPEKHLSFKRHTLINYGKWRLVGMFHIEIQLSQIQRDHRTLEFPMESMISFPDFLALKVIGSFPEVMYVPQGQGS